MIVIVVVWVLACSVGAIQIAATLASWWREGASVSNILKFAGSFLAWGVALWLTDGVLARYPYSAAILWVVYLYAWLATLIDTRRVLVGLPESVIDKCVVIGVLFTVLFRMSMANADYRKRLFAETHRATVCRSELNGGLACESIDRDSPTPPGWRRAPELPLDTKPGVSPPVITEGTARASESVQVRVDEINRRLYNEIFGKPFPDQPAHRPGGAGHKTIAEIRAQRLAERLKNQELQSNQHRNDTQLLQGNGQPNPSLNCFRVNDGLWHRFNESPCQ